MVAKRELKFIKSLHQKKYRSRHGLFLAEGVKLVGELLRSGWEPRQLFTTEPVDGIEGALHISEQDLTKVSTLVQPNKVLGKVLMATMGSVARVRVHYMPLEQTLAGSGLPVFGASMEGEPLGSFRMPGEGILVMGSESHGISQGVAPLLQNTLGISPFGKEEAESLNVAAAAAIFLYEIRRRPAGPTQM
jgi:TrmH family RNA methyltransferase